MHIFKTTHIDDEGKNETRTKKTLIADIGKIQVAIENGIRQKKTQNAMTQTNSVCVKTLPKAMIP